LVKRYPAIFQQHEQIVNEIGGLFGKPVVVFNYRSQSELDAFFTELGNLARTGFKQLGGIAVFRTFEIALSSKLVK
jgi:hypothetical protein